MLMLTSLSVRRGAVRTRVEMSQFLLPYLVVDVLAFPPIEIGADDSAKSMEGAREAILYTIVDEICAVLRTGSHDIVRVDGPSGARVAVRGSTPSRLSRGMLERAAVAGFRGNNSAGSHMSVQAVFSLLDTLGRWQRLASDDASKGKEICNYCYH